MTLTPRGRAVLDDYLARVRLSLAGRDDVDGDDVAAGIAEHVETELSVRGADPATGEDVAGVLEQLGPVESLGGSVASDDAPRDAAAALEPGAHRATAVAVLVVAAVGIALLPTRHMPVGLALLAMSVVAARVVLPGTGPAGVEGRLLRALWHAGVAASALALLIGPAVLAMGAALTGGVLEEPLAEQVGARGSERPLRYWLAMLSVAGAVTGLWWMLLGVLAGRFEATVRRALGPADRSLPARSPRVLLVIGGAFLVVSLVGVLLS